MSEDNESQSEETSESDDEEEKSAHKKGEKEANPMSLQKLIDFDNKVDGFTSEEDNKSQSSSSSDSHS